MAFHTLSVRLCLVLYSPWPTQAFNWTGALQDGDKLEACEGETVIFPWSVRLADGERVEHFDYFHRFARPSVNNTGTGPDVDGQRIEKTDPHFKIFPDDFTLYINRATGNYSGLYTLVLNVTRGNQTHTYRSTVTLSLKERPRTDGRGLQLDTEPEAVKISNGTKADFHVRLSCGFFQHRGQPPVTVDWKSPSGTTLSSTSFHNGRFLLVLPNPTEIGKYTCQVNPASPALQCAGTNDLVRAMAKARLSRAKNEVIVLIAKSRELQTTVSQLQSVVSQLQSTVSQQQSDFSRRQSIVQQQQLTELTSKTCHSIRLEQYITASGVRTLNINGDIVNVSCDQTTDGGGWTVIQRRENGAVDFYRGWNDYVRGFGDPSSEHWLGLERIHLLTKDQAHELRVDLWDFGGSTAFALYRQFSIDGESDNYRLSVGDYDKTSTAGDSLYYHNNRLFSTRDRDNDIYPRGNCAEIDHGGWWYGWCAHTNLNGIYKTSPKPGQNGTVWYSWREFISLKKTEMKILPV